MASAFKRIDNVAVQTTRTLVYTVPAGLTAILFSGDFVNIDSTNKLDHNATLEVLLTDNTTYVPAGKKDVPVTYGGPLSLEKRVLHAGEKVYASADANNVLAVSLSVLEQ